MSGLPDSDLNYGTIKNVLLALYTEIIFCSKVSARVVCTGLPAVTLTLFLLQKVSDGLQKFVTNSHLYDGLQKVLAFLHI